MRRFEFQVPDELYEVLVAKADGRPLAVVVRAALESAVAGSVVHADLPTRGLEDEVAVLESKLAAMAEGVVALHAGLRDAWWVQAAYHLGELVRLADPEEGP